MMQMMIQNRHWLKSFRLWITTSKTMYVLTETDLFLPFLVGLDV